MKYSFRDFPNVKLINAKTESMSDARLTVLYEQARYCEAMTRADTRTLRRMVSEDMTFTHISGRKQTRDEYFADIENGSLRYFTIGIDSPTVEINGDKAAITFTSVLNASAYGAVGIYRIKGCHYWKRQNSRWIAANGPEK